MIFPRDRVVYERLNTSFTHFGELLADLDAKRLTGYVHLRAPAYEGAVFLERGAVVNAVEQPAGCRRTGATALHGISERAGERNGEINVYALTPEVTATLAAVIDSEPLYRDLSTSFTSIERLIEKLGAEGHTGYIQVDGAADAPLGFIFFREGQTVEGVLCAEGQQQTGVEVVPALVAAATALEATFHVFRATPQPAEAPAAPPPPVAPAPPSLEAMPATRPIVVAVATPAPVTEPEAAPEAAELFTPATPRASAAPVEPEPERRAPPASPAAVEVSAADDLPRLLEMWQELLTRVELLIDQLGGQGSFSGAFRRSLVEEALRFPFLDPFAAEFEYKNGAISLAGPADEQLSAGLGVCLSQTIARLGLQLRRPDLETLIRASLVETVARYAAAIERYELRATLAAFLS